MIKMISIFLVFINSAFAIDVTSKTVCEDGICKKVTEVTGLDQKELTESDIIPGKCLFDPRKKKVERILSYDTKSTKIVLLEEKPDLVLLQHFEFVKDKIFNKKRDIIDCSAVSSKIIGNTAWIEKCINENKGAKFKLFCTKLD